MKIDMKILITIFVVCLVSSMTHGYYWERPGCHKVGHTRYVKIPGCVKFEITTNACRGYCSSFSTPSSEATVNANPNQMITSTGECCNIMETEDVPVQVMCITGPKDIVFKSATNCACYHCKKE